MKRVLLAAKVFLVLMCAPFAGGEAAAEKNWYAVLYGGQFADNSVLGLLTCQESPNFNTSSKAYEDFEPSYLVAVAVGKEFARFGRYLGWELEGQVVKHFGFQDNMEFNGLLVARWLYFPWNCYLNTSLALGDGISYATQVPRVEHVNERWGRSEEKVLNYILIELALSLPDIPQWSFVTRVHHRSGIFGLLGDNVRGSNFLCLGLKYTFR
ncbi:MAG: hypothetical protein HPY84_03825 [Syntrophobacteraceae bacterium]|nr:hypothetical protein [Syntrophobacteraceae bacterium]